MKREKRIWISFFVLFLVVAAVLYEGGMQYCSDLLSPDHNKLSIYLVAGNFDRRSIEFGRGAPSPYSVKLEPQALISDTDIMAWNSTNYSFDVSPAAAMRIAFRCEGRERPFVLMAEGRRMFVGLFGRATSSIGSSVPTIFTDTLEADCIVGATNLPVDVLGRILGRDHTTIDKFFAMPGKTTNVTIVIESLERADSPDPLDNPRIVSAVNALFADRNRQNGRE